MTQDDLMTALMQRGLRVDAGTLWEICTKHGLAELRNQTWLPHGWVEPPAVRQAGRTTPESSFEARAARRASSIVALLTAAAGVKETPQPPPGPVPGGWRETASQAARAIHDELDAVTKRRVLTDVPLVDGVEIGGSGGRRLMRFEAEGEVGAEEGTPAQLIVGGSAYEVEIVSVFGAVVTLSLPPDAPPAVEAKLRLDLSWLLTRQRQRLLELVNGGPGFNAAAALAIVNPGARPATPVSRLPASALAGLNEGQRRAVELAAGEGLTWLWGPPGTGKTTTVAALLLALNSLGKRGLLAAPTNAALDVAVQAYLKRRRGVANGSIVRLGQPADPALYNRAGGAVLVDEIAAERGAEIARLRMQHGQKAREARAALKALRRKDVRTAADERERRRLEQDLAMHSAMERELNRGMKEIRRQICQDADIVAATAHQVILDTLRELTFDVVVLDEASMTTAALAMLVVGSGSGHTVIAGDFRQLPPVAVANTPAAQEWLARSPFEKARVSQDVAAGRPPTGLVALTEQYRMRADISDVVSTAFYPQSPLMTARPVYERRRRSCARWTTSDLIVLDTSELMPRTARRQGMLSRYNVTHLQLAAGLLSDAHELADLGLITPFAPQARLLESLVPHERGDAWAASTVHRFQGGERDVVIYDTVDTGNGLTTLHRWFTDGYEGSTGARLLNVAASRAKDHLVVLGAVKSLHNRSADRDAVWTFFAHLLDRATMLPWEEALNSSATERVEKDVVDLLCEDVARADTVDMWLPPGPLPRLPCLVQALLAVPSRGGSEAVTIWTEPGRDGYVEDEARFARSAGVNIRPCVPVVESFAVVGDVVWSSPRPLLSHDPGIVLRTKNAALADALQRAQRRKSVGAPGTGQLADECGRCDRLMVRYEVGIRGASELSYECPVCDRAATSVRRLHG